VESDERHKKQMQLMLLFEVRAVATTHKALQVSSGDFAASVPAFDRKSSGKRHCKSTRQKFLAFNQDDEYFKILWSCIQCCRVLVILIEGIPSQNSSRSPIQTRSGTVQWPGARPAIAVTVAARSLQSTVLGGAADAVKGGVSTLRLRQPRRLTQTASELLMYSLYTSSTSQGGGGSFKNRKPIEEVWLL